MLNAIGASDIEEFYADVPEQIRLDRPLDLPAPFHSEHELARHVTGLLDRNTAATESLSFLGAGCYQHHVPAVCDEINSRSEFLTAYAGEPYEDHGRFQALWEYQSLLGELLDTEVVNVPTYDGFQATATALRMAGRATGRTRVLLVGTIDPDKLSRIRDYLLGVLTVDVVESGEHGLIDAENIVAALGHDLAAVYFEYPGYLGLIETAAPRIVDLAHAVGALAVVSTNPMALGVLAPPASFGADLTCGDLQPLGMHPSYGGGHAGFIASRDDPLLVAEYPSRLFGLVPTTVPGEYGFGDVAYDRTSFGVREQGKEWVGTASALWGITAGVYLALMGPDGMREIGDTIMARTRYAMQRLNQLPGVRVPFLEAPHFTEFVVQFASHPVAEVNRALAARGIFGGVDLSERVPDLGQAALYCVTEVHSQADIDRLAVELEEILP